ncbi:uncharacterized protein LOC144927805 [Branchiostoma floridae x Branchiostoma belcheri]
MALTVFNLLLTLHLMSQTSATTAPPVTTMDPGNESPSWSASSEWDSGHSADRADINTRETADAAGAWAAATNDQDQWLMRDFGDVSVITGIITKGRNSGIYDQYVTSYIISYGDENGDEKFYTNADGQVTVFPANDDRDTEVYNDFRDFSGRITARFVKIHPQTWHGHISMRAKIVTEETCQVGNGASYRGTLAVTETGRTCQRWDRQTPHGHERTARNYPAGGLVENYCRNPDDWSAIWCYTTDPAQRWELCDVPVCGKSLLPP